LKWYSGEKVREVLVQVELSSSEKALQSATVSRFFYRLKIVTSNR
jgi:hypothetical protein